jgi:hypothetical protein
VASILKKRGNCDMCVVIWDDEKSTFMPKARFKPRLCGRLRQRVLRFHAYSAGNWLVLIFSLKVRVWTAASRIEFVYTLWDGVCSAVL